MLCTRRSQKSKLIETVIQKVCKYESLVLTKEMITPLRNLSEGKMYLEKERASLTLQLASLYEKEENIAEAANVLQEVHVETFGSLSKREKIDFLLEQMRVTLLKKDYVRAAIVSNKVNQKALAEDGCEGAKIQFHEYMAEYHRLFEQNSFALAKDYNAIYKVYLKEKPSSGSEMEVDDVSTNRDKKLQALKATIVFSVLSPYSMDQQQMLNTIRMDPLLEKVGDAFKNIIKVFLKNEIIAYPAPYQAELESISVFSLGDLQEHWHELFHTRIIQHNIRVVAKYYKRIHGKRLSELLGLDPVSTEKEVASMVSDGALFAKIDRPKDIIRFSETKTPEAILSDWGSDISKLLNLVDSTSHLIQKENMTHAASSK